MDERHVAFFLLLFLQIQGASADGVYARWYMWCGFLFVVAVIVIISMCYRRHRAAQLRRVDTVQTGTIVVHAHPNPPPPQYPQPVHQHPAGYSNPAYPPGYNNSAQMPGQAPDPFVKATYG